MGTPSQKVVRWMDNETAPVPNASRIGRQNFLATLPAAESFTPSAYLKPMLGHAHRQTETDDGWHYDIDYPSRSGSQPAMLVGDEQLSFA